MLDICKVNQKSKFSEADIKRKDYYLEVGHDGRFGLQLMLGQDKSVWLRLSIY